MTSSIAGRRLGHCVYCGRRTYLVACGLHLELLKADPSHRLPAVCDRLAGSTILRNRLAGIRDAV